MFPQFVSFLIHKSLRLREINVIIIIIIIIIILLLNSKENYTILNNNNTFLPCMFKRLSEVL